MAGCPIGSRAGALAIAGWLAVSLGCGGSGQATPATAGTAPGSGGGGVVTSAGAPGTPSPGTPQGAAGTTSGGVSTDSGGGGTTSGGAASGTGTATGASPASGGGTASSTGSGGATPSGGSGGGPSDACAPLVPAAGDAVEVILSTGTHASCAMAMTSPGGEVALGVQGGAFSTAVTFHLYTPAGTARDVDLTLLYPSSIDDIDPWFHWTAAGYTGIVHDVAPPAASLRTWSSAGTVLASTQDYAVATAPDGQGGSVALLRRVDPGTAPLGPTRLAWIDASGGQVRAVDPGGDPDMVLVSWASGHVLLVASGPDRAEARWMDATGTALTPWFDAGAPFDPRVDASMHLMVDGSIALRAGAAWRATFRDGVPAADPAPPWLAARPGTRLATIRHGTAYAVLPSAQPFTNANQAQLEIVTAAGESCGVVSLPPPVAVPGATKAPTRVDVGQDGTVLQTEVLTGAGLGMGIHCGFRWWPVLVR